MIMGFFRNLFGGQPAPVAPKGMGIFSSYLIPVEARGHP
jgi:hypothetical protein